MWWWLDKLQFEDLIDLFKTTLFEVMWHLTVASFMNRGGRAFLQTLCNVKGVNPKYWNFRW